MWLGPLHLLPPTWGPIWQWYMGNLQVPHIESQIGKGTPKTPLVTITQVGVPVQIASEHWGSCGWQVATAHGGSLLGGHSQRAACTPWDSPPTHWGNPVGNRDPIVDDWEITFLRGGGWEPLEQPLWPTAPHTTRWRVGTKRTTSQTSSPCSTW